MPADWLGRRWRGLLCEVQVEAELMKRCILVSRLRKGADFVCLREDGKIELIEAKAGRSSLTKTQREFKGLAEALGIPYVIVRCKEGGQKVEAVAEVDSGITRLRQFSHTG